MKRRNVRTTLITLVLLLATASPLVSAANQSEEVSRQNVYSIDSTTILSFQDVLSSGSGVEALLCGYNLERTIRGDCDGTSAVEAPGERWFRFTVPPNNMGNQMTLTVDNLGTPDYVDLSVSLCEKSNFSTSMMCEDEGDIYEDESESMKVFPVFTVEYWIKIVAWDETKENREPGGDLTNVRVKLAGNVDSNDDRTEPETMSNGDKLERKVCETGCEDGSTDPMDVFVFNGISGDTVDLRFGSREYDFVCDNDLRIDIGHELDFTNASRTTWRYKLDDCGNYDSDIHRSTKTYTFTESGGLYVLVQDLQGENAAESYTIEVTDYDVSSRDFTADLDGDGLPDYEETQCGSDMRDPTDTAPDHDGDQSCDLRDADDDNDGLLDTLDPCPYSSLTDTDHDEDGCTDEEDNDDDNDGIVDEEDSCPSGMVGTSFTDSDNDGCADLEDLDNDNDGWSDEDETTCGTDRFDDTSVPANWDAKYEAYHLRTFGEDITACDEVDDDDDHDGIIDTEDACQFSEWYTYNAITGVLTITDEDRDADGCFNAEDVDDDNDGVCDGPNDVSGVCTAGPDQCPQGLTNGDDLDGNGCMDAEDDDIDGDGYDNAYERACGTSEIDASQRPEGSEWNHDGDEQCDALDNDDDNDDVLDQNDAFPHDNSEWLDTDNDGEGDNADLDDDDDGVNDMDDDFPKDANEQQAATITSQNQQCAGMGINECNDDDGDGWSDNKETQCKTNPRDASEVPIDDDDDARCDLLDNDIGNNGIADEIEQFFWFGLLVFIGFIALRLSRSTVFKFNTKIDNRIDNSVNRSILNDSKNDNSSSDDRDD